MKDFAENNPVLDQLKSLSIERETISVAPPMKTQSVSKRGSKGLSWIALSAALIGGGIFYADYSGYLNTNDIVQAGQERIAHMMNADATNTDMTTTRATVSTAATAPVPAPQIVPIAKPATVGSGYVVAQKQVQLQSDVAGRITEILVDVGDSVTQGQVLVRLDDRAFQSSLEIGQKKVERAAAYLERVKAEFSDAQRRAIQIEEQVNKGLKPRTTLIDAEQAALLAQANVTISQSEMEFAELEFKNLNAQAEFYTIRAPFDGVVIDRMATQGELVASGLGGGMAQPILSIIDPNALVIEADVSEMNLGEIFPNQIAQVTLDAYPNKSFPATVTSVVQNISIQKGTVLVRLSFDTPPMSVLANMSAKLEFETGTN